MAGYTLPDVTQLGTLDEQELRILIATLFEDSVELQSVVAPIFQSQHATSYKTLIELARAQLHSLLPSTERVNDPGHAPHVRQLDAILNAHPRLGEKKANLSSSSAMEQANLQSSTDEEHTIELRRLNAEYETCFDGLRYLVFVNGRARPEIFEDMRRRMDRGDAWAERTEAIDALCDIAWDRAQKMAGGHA